MTSLIKLLYYDDRYYNFKQIVNCKFDPIINRERVTPNIA